MKPTFSVERFLSHKHDRTAFNCGNSVLNTYIKKFASQDLKRRLSQVFVICQKAKVIAYYTISATSFKKEDLPLEEAKKLPYYPIPAVLIGRLAVDEAWQGKGLGEFILIDALQRILRAGQDLAINAITVEAKDENARSFYLNYGFMPFTHNPLHLYLPTATIEKLLDESEL